MVAEARAIGGPHFKGGRLRFGRFSTIRRGLGGRARGNTAVAAAAAQSLLEQVARGFAKLAAEQALSAAVCVVSARAAGPGLVSAQAAEIAQQAAQAAIGPEQALAHFLQLG